MAYLLFLAALAQPTTPCVWSRTEHAVYRIDHVSTDPSEPCDITPAFDALYADHQSRDTTGGGTGPQVMIAAGDFDMSDTIYIGSATEVAGRGKLRTFIKTSTTGFRCLFRDEAVLLSLGQGGDCYLHDFSVQSTRTDDDVYHAGIELKTQGHVERVRIVGFTHGITMDAGVNRVGVEKSNANLSKLVDVAITFSQHAAIYYDGPDSNAGYRLGVTVSSNCWKPFAWNGQFGNGEVACSAILGSSFLGNSGFADHAASTRPTGSSTIAYPHYVFEGANNASICIGCYGETDLLLDREGELGPLAMALGQPGRWTGGGLRLAGTLASGLRVINDIDPLNKIELRMGNAVGAARYGWSLLHNGLKPLSLGYDLTFDAYRLDVSRSNSAIPFFVGASAASTFGLGGLKLNTIAPAN